MRISDWSSDVCSSDLKGSCRDAAQGEGGVGFADGLADGDRGAGADCGELFFEGFGADALGFACGAGGIVALADLALHRGDGGVVAEFDDECPEAQDVRRAISPFGRLDRKSVEWGK